MEALIVIGLIWAVIAIISHIRKRSSGSRPSSTTYRGPDSGFVRPKQDPNVYHPPTSPRRGSRQGIKFINGGGNASSLTDQDIKDLVDALTGAPLKFALGLYQCQRCKVFYQETSYEVIQSENGGRCVSCLHAEIEGVTGRRDLKRQKRQ